MTTFRAESLKFSLSLFLTSCSYHLKDNRVKIRQRCCNIIIVLLSTRNGNFALGRANFFFEFNLKIDETLSWHWRMGKSQQLSYSKKKKNYPLWFKLSLATTSHKQPSVWVVASLMEGTVYNERERRLVPFICLVRLR